MGEYTGFNRIKYEFITLLNMLSVFKHVCAVLYLHSNIINKLLRFKGLRYYPFILDENVAQYFDKIIGLASHINIMPIHTIHFVRCFFFVLTPKLLFPQRPATIK